MSSTGSIKIKTKTKLKPKSHNHSLQPTANGVVVLKC